MTTLFQRTLVIVAGINGSGKSTAYESDPRFTNYISIINPDVYAKELAIELGAKSINDLPQNVQNRINLKAGKQAVKAREYAFSKGIDFGIETTATSETTLKLIDKAHSLKYRVMLVYFMLPNVDLHITRVNQRVKMGGHFVSDEDISRRYIRAHSLFPKLLNKADIAYVYDNTYCYNLALEKNNGKYKLFSSNEEIKEKLEKAVKEITKRKIKMTDIER